MQVEERVLVGITKLIEIARRRCPYGRPFKVRGRWRKSYHVHEGIYWICRKYIYVHACGLPTQLIVLPDGTVYREGSRKRPLSECYGDIGPLADETLWKKRLIKVDWDESRIVVPGCASACERCGRDKKVYLAKTVLGTLCQYCRGSDQRHIGAVRAFGLTPTIDGVPFEKYER